MDNAYLFQGWVDTRFIISYAFCFIFLEHLANILGGYHAFFFPHSFSKMSLLGDKYSERWNAGCFSKDFFGANRLVALRLVWNILS